MPNILNRRIGGGSQSPGLHGTYSSQYAGEPPALRWQFIPLKFKVIRVNPSESDQRHFGTKPAKCIRVKYAGEPPGLRMQSIPLKCNGIQVNPSEDNLNATYHGNAEEQDLNHEWISNNQGTNPHAPTNITKNPKFSKMLSYKITWA